MVAEAGGFVDLPGVLEEEEGEEGEEEAGDLVPEDAGGVGEGASEGGAEASCAAGEAAGVAGGLPGEGRVDARGGAGSGAGSGRSGSRGRGRGGGGCAEAVDAVAELFPGDTRADAEDSADAVGLHEESLAAGGSGFGGGRGAAWAGANCGVETSEDKVGEGQGEEPGKRGSALDQKLRKLVQQLGEAIHESVSESEQIAGVVADIRRQGFEVLLMLEATIGLNEVEEQPAGALGAGKTAKEEDGTFTAQDLHFLKSLRIAVSGEQGESEGPGEGEDG